MARSKPQKGAQTPKSLNLQVIRGKTPWEQEQLVNLGTTFAPKFLVATRTDGGDFKEVKSILFSRHIEGVFGELEQVQKMRNGSLLLKTCNSTQAEKLLASTHFGELPVKVEEHKTLNQVRGVIFHRDLLYNTDEELIDDMKHRGVTNVRRITRKVNDRDVPTGAFIVTFNLPVLPEKVKATSYRCDVRPYIPAPMRCFQCQRFGHMVSRCTNVAICGSCGKEPHGAEECTLPPKCTNCPGLHSPRDRNCPVFVSEKKIQEIRTLERLSYQEARRKFNTMTAPARQIDYSAVVQSLAKSSSPFVSSVPQTAANTSRPATVEKTVETPVPVPVVSNPKATASTSSGTKRPSPKVGPAPPPAKKKPAPVKTKSPAQQEKPAKAPSPKRSALVATKPAEAANPTKAGNTLPSQSTKAQTGKKVPPRKEDFMKKAPVASTPTAGTVEADAPAPAEASTAKPPRSPRRRSPRKRRESKSSSGSRAPSVSSSTGGEMECDAADSDGSSV